MDEQTFNPSMYPSCGCPPRPPEGSPWEETCAWYVEHYSRAMTGDKGHRQGHPKVCERKRDGWLDAIITHRELYPERTHRLLQPTR